MTTLTRILATDGQIKQIARFASDAAEKAVKDYEGLDKEGAQRVHRNAEFTARIREATALVLAELARGRYADEEVQSNYTYPPEYCGPKSLTEQVATLKELFLELKDATFDEIVADSTLPEGAEGWFAIPRWQALAPTYGEAVEKVFGALQQFYNYRAGKLGPAYLQETEKKANAFRQLAEAQAGHDILVVPAQFGFRHRGRSVRRAREMMPEREFGLGAFGSGCMLLTHPERFVRWEQLHVDCADGGFSYAPRFYWYGGWLEFVTDDVRRPSDRFGSASGFLPQ